MTSAMISVARSSWPSRAREASEPPATSRSISTAPGTYARTRTVPLPSKASRISPACHSSPGARSTLSTTAWSPQRPKASQEFLVSSVRSTAIPHSRIRSAIRSFSWLAETIRRPLDLGEQRAGRVDRDRASFDPGRDRREPRQIILHYPVQSDVYPPGPCHPFHPAHGVDRVALSLACQERVGLLRLEGAAADHHLLDPISHRRLDPEGDLHPLVPHEPAAEPVGGLCGEDVLQLALQPVADLGRSEERRVGKEGRSGW